MMRACVTPAYVCGLETAALTRPQQQKLTFARSTRSIELQEQSMWMNDVREDFGKPFKLTERIVRIRIVIRGGESVTPQVV